jgi:fumarate reductase flavoprotein subunit
MPRQQHFRDRCGLKPGLGEREKSMAQKVLECDLVVIGAGGAGLVAAVKASDDCGKKVIVLEKAKKPGGSTYFAGGPGLGGGPPGGGGGPGGPGGPGAPAGQGGPGSQGGPGGSRGGGPFQMTSTGESAVLTNAFNTWYAAKSSSDKTIQIPNTELYEKHPDPSIGPGSGGSQTIELMFAFAKKQGIQVLTETPARKFVTDAGGKVTGVLAEDKDGEVLVKCKACIIAAGGFGRNYEMLRKRWPEEYNYKEIFFLCPPGMTGDGINMAEAIGAHIDQDKWDMAAAGGFYSAGAVHHPYSWALQAMMRDARFVSITLEGKRWKNEKIEKSDDFGPSLANLPGAVAYAVADADVAEAAGAILEAGGVGPDGNPYPSFSSEGKALKKWREDLEYEARIDEEGASGNHAKKANSLVELALKMGVDPAAFVATIERYNSFCNAKKDLDFGKPAESLVPIHKPPFYAIYGHRYSQCTKGLNGIAVNINFEVLNSKGEVMPGLWAGGDTCTIYGDLKIQGGPVPDRPAKTLAPGDKNPLHLVSNPCGGSRAAMMAGYRAGIHAAEFLKKL